MCRQVVIFRVKLYVLRGEWRLMEGLQDRIAPGPTSRLRGPWMDVDVLQVHHRAAARSRTISTLAHTIELKLFIYLFILSVGEYGNIYRENLCVNVDSIGTPPRKASGPQVTALCCLAAVRKNLQEKVLQIKCKQRFQRWMAWWEKYLSRQDLREARD